MITLSEAIKQWTTICPSFKKLKSNVFYENNKLFLSVFGLHKLPHGINEYAMYYQLYSLFEETGLHLILNYQIKNIKGLQLNVTLNQTKDAHKEFLKSNIAHIKSQFLFSENNNVNDIDSIISRIEWFLENGNYSENKIPTWMFLMQLSSLNSSKMVFEKYLNYIEGYDVLPFYYTSTFGMSKEKFIQKLENGFIKKKSGRECKEKH